MMFFLEDRLPGGARRLCHGDSLLRGISTRTGTRRPSSRSSRPRRCSFELEAGPVVAGGGGSKELEALAVVGGGGSKVEAQDVCWR